MGLYVCTKTKVIGWYQDFCGIGRPGDKGLIEIPLGAA